MASSGRGTAPRATPRPWFRPRRPWPDGRRQRPAGDADRLGHVDVPYQAQALMADSLTAVVTARIALVRDQMPRSASTAWRTTCSIRRLVGQTSRRRTARCATVDCACSTFRRSGQCRQACWKALPSKAWRNARPFSNVTGKAPGNAIPGTFRKGSWQCAPTSKVTKSGPGYAQRILLPMSEPIHTAPALVHRRSRCLPLRRRRAGSGTSSCHSPRCGSPPLAQRPTSACDPPRRADRCR